MTLAFGAYLIREVLASDAEEAAAEASGQPRPAGSLYYRNKKVRFYLFSLIQGSLFLVGSMYWVAGSYPICAVNDRYGQEPEGPEEDEESYFAAPGPDVERVHLQVSTPKTPVMQNYGSLDEEGEASSSSPAGAQGDGRSLLGADKALPE
jgi:hypothetical protein